MKSDVAKAAVIILGFLGAVFFTIKADDMPNPWAWILPVTSIIVFALGITWAGQKRGS